MHRHLYNAQHTVQACHVQHVVGGDDENDIKQIRNDRASGTVVLLISLSRPLSSRSLAPSHLIFQQTAHPDRFLACRCRSQVSHIPHIMRSEQNRRKATCILAKMHLSCQGNRASVLQFSQALQSRSMRKHFGSMLLQAGLANLAAEIAWQDRGATVAAARAPKDLAKNRTKVHRNVLCGLGTDGRELLRRTIGRERPGSVAVLHRESLVLEKLPPRLER